MGAKVYVQKLCCASSRVTHRKQPCHIAQFVGLKPVNETILLAKTLLKQLLVSPIDVAEPLAQVTVVTADHDHTKSAASISLMFCSCFIASLGLHTRASSMECRYHMCCRDRYNGV